MWTIEELLEYETPYLKIEDITEEDWISLDFELEKYDKSGKEYDLKQCKVLAFILQQIHYDKSNFIKTPNFIHNGTQFQELAVVYNEELKPVLFPIKNEIIVEKAITKHFCPVCSKLSKRECVSVHSDGFDFELNLCREHFKELKDKINSFTLN